MFEKKKILILGFARSGYECARLLAKKENDVYLTDMKTDHDKDKIEELEKLGVKLILGEHPDNLLDKSFDYLIKNPGVPIDHKYVIIANNLGIEVINEVEMAYKLLPKGVKIIAITGTNGKTTTTTITYEIMKMAFKDKAHLGGNIGLPFSGILKDIKENDYLVIEISCQQGENLIDFTPDVGVFTNLSEAHIDFMKTYEHYKFTKTKMFFNQNSQNVAIINIEDKGLLEELEGIKSKKKYFSSQNKTDGCYLKDNSIYYYDELVLNIDDIKIKGVHNLENIMAAIMAVKEFGVSNDIIKEVVTNFKGVEHRLEYVDTVKGVSYYNDTQATNILGTRIALSSFKERTIIFLGGLDRGQDFNDLKCHTDNVKAIFAIGQNREKVENFAKKNNIKVYVFEYLKDAFLKAQEIVEEDDVVLLSPGSASWDQYKNAEERGQQFKDLVKNIK